MTSNFVIQLSDVEAAARRIHGRVRKTPMLDLAPLKAPFAVTGAIVAKLESLQVTGSFKARGAVSKLLSLDEASVKRGIVTASGGNHGVAVAYAGWIAGTPTTIVTPTNVSPLKAEKIKAWGANLIIKGDYFEQCAEIAQELVATQGLTYLHPFADPMVMAGQGTVALELMTQDPAIDTILISIGGGGLISGMAVAAKAIKPSIRLIGVEPVGAPTMHASLKAGEVVMLDQITSRVPTMSAKSTDPMNFAIAQAHVEDIVLVEDDAMLAASRQLWFECGVAADLSGAASLAALQTGGYVPAPGERVCALICGAGAEGIA
jgi:threonine dehydratase